MAALVSVQGAEQLRVEGELAIQFAAELKDTLLRSVQATGEVTLDLSGVSEVDTAGIQLLLLAKRAAAAVGCRLRYINHSPAVVDVVELLNLSATFGDPILLAVAAGADR